MKKRHILLLISALVLCLSGCRYPEPSPDIHSPEYRLIGSWQLQHTFLNGTEIDSTDYYANMPGTYYYMYADHILNVMAYHNGELRQSTFSTWVLQDKNKKLSIDFTVLGRRYTYTADIKKLTCKELFYEYDDEENNHWRLELYSASAF